MKPHKPLFILFLTAVMLYNISGQDLPFNNTFNKIEYQGINEYSNYAKDDLFYLAKEWLLINDFIILMEDSASTRILAEKMFKSHYPGESGIRYNLILDFKDKKVRYNFTNFKILKFKDPLTYSIQSNYGTYLIKEDEGEIIIKDAEEFYPVDKINPAERKAYNFFFNEMDYKVRIQQAGLKNYLGQKDNW